MNDDKYLPFTDESGTEGGANLWPGVLSTPGHKFAPGFVPVQWLVASYCGGSHLWPGVLRAYSETVREGASRASSFHRKNENVLIKGNIIRREHAFWHAKRAFFQREKRLESRSDIDLL